ncbi:hypothetical protein [Bradyrhizobium forestalis]|uniref:hypothetical protein n=1 Tax=Bradyrhizobium forestalis TaxID=1419263 RepID=UPI0011AEFF61|nr:hypothetical protein [Bradyrhizobium forestalis]
MRKHVRHLHAGTLGFTFLLQAAQGVGGRLSFKVDENHPPALDERGMFEATQLFCKPVVRDE